VLKVLFKVQIKEFNLKLKNKKTENGSIYAEKLILILKQLFKIEKRPRNCYNV
jgi:hypothetical protein